LKSNWFDLTAFEAVRYNPFVGRTRFLANCSEVKDVHDRYANNEVAYLLQKIAQYDGFVIPATNLNIDQAFKRRVNYTVDFPFRDERASRITVARHVSAADAARQI
jgi:hypothetical protein